MQNRNMPSLSDLPSVVKLIKSTILAIGLAAVILVTVVLPAEYGIDPTGIGNFIGLLNMGEIKVSLAEEAAADKAAALNQPAERLDENQSTSKAMPEDQANSADTTLRSDEITISLAPNEGKEIKLTMAKGGEVDYAWWTSGGKANFDAHADSKALQIKYHNYSKGAEKRSEGLLEAAFDGKHGWFWRNRTPESMTVTLKVSGEYSSIDRVK